MDQIVSLFPEQASTAAEKVDALLIALIAVTSIVGLLIFAAIIYFCVKYRKRPGHERGARIFGSWQLETLWSVIPLGIFMVFFVWSVDVLFFIVRPPEDALQVYVVGKQWMWKIQHPDGQREINRLHVPVGQPVRLTLISEDVIHSFYVPAFRIKVDVLPDRYVTTWFQATKTGRFRLFCAEYCGTDHSAMIGEVIVMQPEEYQEWLSSRAEGSLALEGRKMLLKYQCVTCHSADGVARCPTLEDIYGRSVSLRGGGTAFVDDNYLRESILNPEAKVVAGFEPIMPSFEGQINEEELLALVAYLRTATRGDTPPRLEQAPAPEIGKTDTPQAAKPDGKKPSGENAKQPEK